MIPATRWVARLFFLVALAGTAGCEIGLIQPDDKPQEEVADPGLLAIQVVQAAAGTGAVLLVVSGGPIQHGALAGGLTGKVVIASGSELRMLVRGGVGQGIVATIQVPDRRISYSVRLLEAAADGAGGYRVLDSGQFSLRVARP
ncbi:MAG: hypothetical protein SGI84_03310 [Gemmatimonadota bacterium]|nr:hypothetical protein [Gemmatimonadota bacterium]